ncbi:hypothetical protein Taro_024850 [Colocasia esculenta]|uniref:Charged multivesicular body protein 7 n=1 Tax=Colocasia esculenta TaxID=4460 RepID=A0A843V7C5_COLES|nr:hypothetical protein [Colocasia esculenta]
MGPPAPAAVEAAVRAEAPDWDNDAAWMARFSAFSGQRPDWAPRYLFWSDLILRVARRLGVFTVPFSEVKNVWFARGGLTPLCIDRVLIEMHKEGDILLRGDLVDPTSGHLYQMFRRVGQLFGLLKSSLEENNDECIILRALLQACRKAQYLSIRKTDFVEGVKVSLVAASVPNLSSLDFDMLHLIWTIEKLQQQLDMIDQRWDMKRKLALSSLKCGKKQAAYRYLRQAKLLSEGRGKCALLLDRVEEVFSTITHTESTKKVAEAIQIGAQAIKDNQISVEEVHSCLEELDESVSSQKQVDEALGSMSLNDDIEDQDIEEDFKKLELELRSETHEEGAPEAVRVVRSDETPRNQESTDLLTDSLSSLHLEAA